MKKIKLFLAATESELQEDRMAISDLLATLNEKYEDKELYFQLVKPKQAPKAEDIEGCEMAFILWFRHSDEITSASFEQALQAFQQKGSPKIVTYFKQSDQSDIADDVSGFMERLDKELGHYYNMYSHIDSLRFSILMQMSLLEQSLQVECKSGKVTLGGDTMLSIYDLPCAGENKLLTGLQEQMKKATVKFYELRELHADDEENQELTEGYIAASEDRGRIREQIAQIEKSILCAAISMAQQVASGSLSLRQREAYRLFEKGDYEGANEILNFDEIKEDIKNAEDVAEIAGDKLKTGVMELLQKIDVIKAGFLTKAGYDDIKACFIEAVRVEQGYNLPKIAMEQYMIWLADHHEYSEAIEITEKLMLYYKLSGSDTLPLEGRMGQLYYNASRYEEAKEICQRLSQNSSCPKDLRFKMLLLLGRIFLNGFKLQDMEDYREKIQELGQDLCETLSVYEKKDFWIVMADICVEQGDYVNAVNWLKQGVSQLEDRGDEPQAEVLECLIEVRLRLGELYCEMGVMEEAQDILFQVGTQVEGVMDEDVIKHGLILARIKLALAATAQGFCYVTRARMESDDALMLMIPLYEHEEKAHAMMMARACYQKAKALFGLGIHEKANELVEFAVLCLDGDQSFIENHKTAWIEAVTQLSKLPVDKHMECFESLTDMLSKAKAMAEQDQDKSIRSLVRLLQIEEIMANNMEEIGCVIEKYEKNLKEETLWAYRGVAEAYQKRALLHIENGNGEQAIENIAEAAEVIEAISLVCKEPPICLLNQMKLYYMIGKSFLAMGETQNAIDSFDVVINMFFDIPEEICYDNADIMELYIDCQIKLALANWQTREYWQVFLTLSSIFDYFKTHDVVVDEERLHQGAIYLNAYVSAWRELCQLEKSQEGKDTILPFLDCVITTLEQSGRLGIDGCAQLRLEILNECKQIMEDM